MKSTCIILRSNLFTVFFLLITFSEVSAQDFYDDDARFWLYLKMDKKITPKLETQINLQNRFNNNITEYSQINFNGELSYKINKHFKLQGGYVWGQKRKIEGIYFSRQQFYGGFLLRQKWQTWTLVYRNLVQAQTRATYNRARARELELVSRNKLTAKYELNKRLTAYVAGEINLPLSRIIEQGENVYLAINRLRTFAGLEYTLTRRSYIEAYFLYQRKFLTKGLPPRDFIYGLTYSHSF